MTAADLLSERASALARSDSRDADAITELLMMADGHRVPSCAQGNNWQLSLRATTRVVMSTTRWSCSRP